MKKLKKWIGPLLWVAGVPLLYFLPKDYAAFAFLPAMLHQMYDLGHFNGWMEGFKQCEQINKPFMELDQKRILAMAKKLSERERPN